MMVWLAALPMVPRLPQRNIHHELAPAADGAALVMVGLVFFLLGCIAVGALVLHRRAMKHPNTPSDDHQRQLGFSPKSDQLTRREGDKEESGSEPWERPADWWK